MAIRTEDHSDLKKFGNRLWYVMTGKGYTTPRALATSLYDQQLVSVKSKPGKYTRKEDIRKNAISSVEKKIVRHLHADAADDVQGEFLLAYCRHLDCSSDYLLGLTNVTSGDIEVRRICEKKRLAFRKKRLSILSMIWSGIHKDLFIGVGHHLWKANYIYNYRWTMVPYTSSVKIRCISKRL